MKLTKTSLDGVQFFYREGYSDIKTFIEVLSNKSYLKKGMEIQNNETWLDCGGNVGAFSLLAASKGASVITYEPDPFNCELIEKNAKLNGFQNAIKIKQAALVHDDRKETTLSIAKDNNVWRSSIMKKKSNKAITVPCLNFDEQAILADNCKMDIEGAEIPILTNTKSDFNKLVYEWSFDIDPYLPNFWNVLDKQKTKYLVDAPFKSTHYKQRDITMWGDNWFPPCVMVYCFKRV